LAFGFEGFAAGRFAELFLNFAGSFLGGVLALSCVLIVCLLLYRGGPGNLGLGDPGGTFCGDGQVQLDGQ
jgi:hypothetical protein